MTIKKKIHPLRVDYHYRYQIYLQLSSLLPNKTTLCSYYFRRLLNKLLKINYLLYFIEIEDENLEYPIECFLFDGQQNILSTVQLNLNKVFKNKVFKNKLLLSFLTIY